MDFNFAKSYIKEKPKSSLINVIVPVTVIGLLGGISLLCVASYLNLWQYQQTTEELKAEMSSPDFINAYSQVNKLSAELSQIQQEYGNLALFEYIMQEHNYCNTQLFDILVRTSMEGCYTTGFVVGADGTIAMNGTADSMAHVAMMENRLRKDDNILGVSVSALAQSTAVDAQTDEPNPYTFASFFGLQALTVEQRTILLVNLGLYDQLQPVAQPAQPAQPPTNGSPELPDATEIPPSPEDIPGGEIIT